jgi:3-phenylpropionate/cinnamic acid dioxygenase small subunit
VFDDPCTLITQQPGKPPRHYEGRAAVERFFNKAVNNDMKLLRHRITDHLIKVNGDRADARLYWDEIREQNGQLILGGGIYFDKLRRIGDGWKFTERHALSTYWISLIDKVDEGALATRVLLAPRPKHVRVWGRIVEHKELQVLLDKFAVQETAVRYAAGADQRRWDLWEEIFTDPIELFLSPRSQETRKISRTKWIELEKGIVESYAATQHALSNFMIEVEGDKAVCQVYVQARHFVKDTDSHDGYGYYTFHMIRAADGWKINKYGITLKAQDQNHRENLRRTMKIVTEHLK